MQNYTLPRQAKFCKCGVAQLPNSTYEENIMESQAIGIAPRILMPKVPFIDVATQLNVGYEKDNWKAICQLADFYDVSKQSVKIRLEECNLI
jgi:Zn-dependent peptidase ImmA (M78 family)